MEKNDIYTNETYLRFIDWLELKVVGAPDLARLALLGYNTSGDSPRGSYKHSFEAQDFILIWDNSSPYLKVTYTHFRVKNEMLYKYTDYNELESDLMQLCRFIFPLTYQYLKVSRIDWAFDFVRDGSIYERIKKLFTDHNIKKVSNYVSFYNRSLEFDDYINYSAGSRMSLNYYRLYNKSAENKDKKNYINKIHREAFGDNQVYRFEIEYKPENLQVKKGFLNYLFDKYEHYFQGFNLVREHSTYDRKISILTIKDIKDFQRILDKIEQFDGVNFREIRDYTDAIVKYIK